MQEFKHLTRIRARYCETDQMGVVYHARYLDWFEIGRTDLCRANGKSFALWEKEGILLPVVEAHCRYKSSAFYEDEIIIETSITKLSQVSVTFSCRIFNAESNKLLAEGYTKHAFTSRDGKLLRGGNALESWLSKIIESHE